jgi:hypothetical protein
MSNFLALIVEDDPLACLGALPALSLHLNIYVSAGRFHVLWSPESKRRHFSI